MLKGLLIMFLDDKTRGPARICSNPLPLVCLVTLIGTVFALVGLVFAILAWRQGRGGSRGDEGEVGGERGAEEDGGGVEKCGEGVEANGEEECIGSREGEWKRRERTINNDIANGKL